jgi:glycosyltransferase involved in cell wall biosynthesis
LSGHAPSTVFGLTVYNGEAHLAEALESLLAQSRNDLAIVVVDDCSDDGSRAVALEYAELDPRVVYERNDRQLGLVRNWRRALEVAVARFPTAPYFAWASDHDVWHPLWLEETTAALDAHPEAVLAYPLGIRIDDAGAEYPTRERPFGTEGIADPTERVRRTASAMTAAGEMIYGLMRWDALVRSGPYPLVVLADRLQLLRLAVEGEFRQVDRRLWYRRYRPGVAMTNSRQRRASFPDGVPLSAYLPWWLTHAFSFGGRLGRVVLLESIRHAYTRNRRRAQRRRRWRRRERRQRLRALLRPTHSVEPTSGTSGPQALPKLDRDVLAALERPGATVVELGKGGLSSADLAVGVDAFAGLADTEMDELARRLHDLGIPALYCVERESPGLRAALGRWYWLRDVWVPQEGSSGRKPDPNTGPVPREPGSYRHLVGRRRLIPGGQS